MGTVGKVIGATVVAAVVVGFATSIMHGGGTASSLVGSPEDRCADRINGRLPSGAFVISHTRADANGRSEWLIDHGGLRESVACTAKSDGTVALAALGHD